jgi:TRAP-type mannitol/chloroaromatic compound transport system permease small subunit
MTDGPEHDVTEEAEELLEQLGSAHHTATPLTQVPGGVIGLLHRVRLGIETVTTVTGSMSMVLAWIVFGLGFFNVVTRYASRFLDRSIIVGQVFDLQWMMFGALFLLGFNYGVREEVNPRIDFWWANFRPRTKAWIDFVLHLLLFLPFMWVSLGVLWNFSATALGRTFDGRWLTWQVWEVWERSGDAGGLPRGPIKALMTVGFVLFASQIVAQVIKSGFVLIGRQDLADITHHRAPTRIE